MNELLKKEIEKIAKNQVKILDDFIKAYIAGRMDEKWFDIKRIKLVQKTTYTNDWWRVEYWFEQRRGRLKK